jgi:hypothetical protein
MESERGPAFCFDAFSSREPASTSLENAIGPVVRRDDLLLQKAKRRGRISAPSEASGD